MATPSLQLQSLGSILLLPSDVPEFVQQLPDKYKCEICGTPLKFPVVQTSCGHRFDKECLENYIRTHYEGVVCPVEEEDCVHIHRSGIYPDHSVVREMIMLMVYCSHKEHGCQDTMPWRHLKEHVIKCVYRDVDCPYRRDGCDELVLLKDLEDHIDVCEYRNISCEYCREQMIFLQAEEHLQTMCPMVLVPCPYHCDVQVYRAELEKHKLNCLKRPNECIYRIFGCLFTGSPEAMERHLTTSKQKHLDYCLIAFSDRDMTLLTAERKYESLAAANIAAKRGLDEARREHTALKDMLDSGSIDIRNIEKKILQQARHVSEIEIGLTRKIDVADECVLRQEITYEAEEASRSLQSANILNRLDGSGASGGIGALEQQITAHDTRMDEVDDRFRRIESTSLEGFLIWKITGFSLHRDRARTGQILALYSPPFYSERFGYKACAKMYPNGDGGGRDTHLSLYFLVLKGEYDNILKWPFRKTVTLALLDQNASCHLSDTFVPALNSSKKPDAVMNVASGCPQFVAFSILFDKNQGYLKDDTIFIKVAISPN